MLGEVGKERPTLARYEVLGRLAAGGMGEVWLARAAGPAGFEKQIVLKTIRGDAANEAVTQMFLREARVAALLNHPNCVQVFDLGEEGGTYFIAMEYIDGFSLARVMKRAVETEHAMPIEIAVRILIDAAAGLGYAHALKDNAAQPLSLVHRDVSLENILITFAGQTKIVDFGIAKAAIAIAGERTETGLLKGKYAYMAPEYLRSEPIDGRADLFALGVVGFRLLARERPFRGETDAHVMAAILGSARAPRVRSIRPELPEALDDVVAKLLAKDPAERFDSARAVQAALVEAVPAAADVNTVAAFMETLWGEDDHDRVAVRRLMAGEVSGSRPALTPTPPSFGAPGAWHAAATMPLGSAPLRASTSAETILGPAPTAVDAPAPKSRRRALAISASTAVALAAAGGVYFALARGDHGAEDTAPPPLVVSRAPAPAPGADHARVAVLPFTSEGVPVPPDYIVAGLRDGLVVTLSQLGEIALASTRVTDEAADQPVPALARRLGVTAIVSGRVSVSGDHVSLALALVDGASGKQIWTHREEGMVADVLTLEDRVARDVIAGLGIQPGPDELARTLVHPTENVEAYDLYLQGRRASRDVTDAASMLAAITLYERALAKDPRFAFAYAGIAEDDMRMYERTKLPVWSTRALSAAQQAAQLDDHSAEVHSALGFVYRRTGRTAAAVAELRRATELEPSSDEAYRHLGNAYADAGKSTEAIAAYRKAIAVNPYFWANYGALSEIYGSSGEIDQAIETADKMAKLAPDEPYAWNGLGEAYERSGRRDEAVAAFEKALALKPTPEAYGNLAFSYGQVGKFSDAVATFEKAVAQRPHDAHLLGGLADAYWWQGAREANALYDRAIAAGLDELKVNPRDAGVRSALATWYAKRGDAAHAAAMSARARAIDKVNKDYLYNDAIVEMCAHHYERAFARLDDALAGGYTASWVAHDPDLRAIYDDPRFAALLAKYAHVPTTTRK
jgi:serine/threonine-protein kinase